jgi:hypothetical protein
LKPGSTIRLPERLACGGCRRESTLEPGAAGDFAYRTATTSLPATDGGPPPGIDAAELEAYWRQRCRTSVWSPASSDYGAGDPWRRRRMD